MLGTPLKVYVIEGTAVQSVASMSVSLKRNG